MNLTAKVIENNLTTDDFALFFVICSALIVGIALYYRR